MFVDMVEVVNITSPSKVICFYKAFEGLVEGVLLDMAIDYDVDEVDQPLDKVAAELKKKVYQVREEEIKKLAKNPRIYEMLAQSVAPAIYGHEVVKESIALELFGGVTKHLPNDQKIRGNIHILLIGDPGCLVGDERVVMGNGAIKKIKDLGKNHLEEIDLQVLTGEGGKKRARAKTFFK